MKEIITKYLEGRAIPEEQVKLLHWLRDKNNKLFFKNYKVDWKNSSDSELLPKGSEKSWHAIQETMLQSSYSRWQKSRNMYTIFKIAAIFFFVISLAGTAFFISSRNKLTSDFYTRVVADNGQISKVQLPDGSMVWLNSGSEISYNNLFAANNRKIELTGEAFFQVTKNEKLPLVVNSGEIQVKVLGTRFNVTAYPESEKIDIVLEKGKVELLNSNLPSFQYFMKPGEMASFSKVDCKLALSSVNTSKYTSWKDGVINIYNQTLDELCERLELRYNQKFMYSDELRKYHFTFTIKNETLEETIDLMSKIAPIKTEQKGDVIEFEIDEKRKREYR